MTDDNREIFAIFRMRYGPNALWISYEDGLGRRRVPPVESGDSPDWISNFSGWPIPLAQDGIKIPADFDDLLRGLLLPLPLYQPGIHNSGPVPLPIFFEPPSGHSAIQAWEAVVASLLPADIDRDRIQAVRLSKDKLSVTQYPLILPLRVLAIGSRCDSALEGFSSANWYESNPAVQELGISLETAELEEADSKLRAERRDIVLADASSVDQLLRMTARLSLRSRKRPRLVIFLAPVMHEPYVMNLEVPSGAAFLWLPLKSEASYWDTGTREFVKRFFYGIVHDYPLHEALKSATRVAGPALARPALLIAGTRSNNALRLSDAMHLLQSEVSKVRAWNRLGNIGQFIDRSGGDFSDLLKTRLLELNNWRTNIHNAVDLVNSDRIWFDQESRGLVPLVNSVYSLAVARKSNELIETTAAALVADAEFAGQIRKHQERRVDVSMQQLDTELTYKAVDSQVPLQLGLEYRVNLHIGHRTPESLMLGEPPPVDPLLPDIEKGHNLEVALFAKDFESLSKEVQALYLPSFGGSEVVHFDIRAPKRIGAAEARIGIYYQNNLLQSFLLKANIAQDDQSPLPLKLKLYLPEPEGKEGGGARWVEIDTDRQVAVHLAFTQTARFTNLELLAPRALSMGVNQDQNADSHTFMLKVDGFAQSLNVKEKILDEQTAVFRTILKDNVRDAQKKPLFKTYPVAGDERSVSFKSVMRQLIETGARLHNALFPRVSRKMQGKLRALAEDSDKTIQVIRHDATSVFPWPILYDYLLPTKISGAPDPTICLGFDKRSPAAAATYPVKTCSHGPTKEGYCIYGFWGLRHEVEQLVEIQGDPKDSVSDITLGSQSFVRMASGTDDQHTKDLADKMVTEMGTAFTANPADDLVEIMWDDTTRPGILIVLGHLQMTPIDGEPDEPRIVLVPSKKWFLASSVLKRLKQDKEWDQPNSLVLLLACGAGATEITTLNDFVMNLTVAGAAAVIGTECIAFSSLVSRFAGEITSNLWNKKSLGEAMKIFNRRLVTAGNPLAFIFNCLGNADIKLIKAD